MKRFSMFFLIIAIFGALIAAPIPAAANQPIDLTAVSASPGGAWFATMGGLAELINRNDPYINVTSIPGSGAANALTVGMGINAQMGFTFPPFAIAAMNATEPFEGRPKAENLRAIHAGFGLSPIQFAMRKDFAERHGIKTMRDIVEKQVPIRIVTNNPGASDEFVGRKLFEFFGATYDDIQRWGGRVTLTGYTDSVQLMQDGHADMAINNIAAPAGPFVEMLLNVPLVFLDIGDDGRNYLFENLGHVPHTIPAGTYSGQYEDILTGAMYSVHVVNADVPEDVVYRITKIILENEETFRTFAANTRNFEASTSFEGTAIPLHPGAERYFREAGFLP